MAHQNNEEPQSYWIATLLSNRFQNHFQDGECSCKDLQTETKQLLIRMTLHKSSEKKQRAIKEKLKVHY